MNIEVTDEPLVSIITVCLNSEKTISDTLNSVLNQSYKNIEYIIIDGISSDNTINIIKKFAEETNKSITLISEHDNGLYDAMNKGIKLAKGNIIGIINSDDWYEHDAVFNIVDCFNKGKVDAVQGNMNVYDSKKILYIAKPYSNLDKLRKGMVMNHPTLFVKKEVYNKYGSFDIDIKTAADWDFALRLWKNNVKIGCTNNVIANFRVGGISFAFNIEMIKEKHFVRKKNKIYKLVDIYYIFDLLKLIIPEKLMLRISLTKTKFKNRKI